MLAKTGTKTILANALRDLLKDKDFEDITIENILERSGASRATFYRHFEDKFSLMCWVYKEAVDEMISKNPKSSEIKIILTQSARFMKDNQSYFSEIVKFQGQNSFSEFIFTYVKSHLIKNISEDTGMKELPYEILFAIEFYCSGIVFIITEWLKSGLKKSPELIAELLYECIPQPIMKYFV